MVAGFLDAITKVRQFRFHNDDDFVDRLSRRYSVVLLMLFTVVVSTKQYVGDRKFLNFLIQCKIQIPEDLVFSTRYYL
jgi:hypothetical protein